MRVRVVARFKNDNFIQARILAGYETQAALAEAIGACPNTICNYENFNGYATKRRIIDLLEQHLHCPYDYLFPKEYKDAVRKKLGRKIEKTFDLLELPEHERLALPEVVETRDIEEKRRNVENALKTLGEREAKILKMRFGLEPYEEEHTLEEIGREFKVTRERIRSIEAKGLRKLKHPERARVIDPDRMSRR